MKIHSLIAAVLFLASIFLSSCTKTSTTQLENFSFKGYLTECTTGLPLANKQITVWGSVVTQGFLGPLTNEYKLGQTLTDINGYFKVTPLKYGGVSYFFIQPDSTMLYISYIPGISSDSISKTHQSSYDLSFSANRYGYLKLMFSDTSSPDPADQLALDVWSNNNNCGPSFNSISYKSYPMPPSKISLDNFAGNIQNGYAYYSVMGNDTIAIYYSKQGKNLSDSPRVLHLYCKENDTTYFSFNY